METKVVVLTNNHLLIAQIEEVAAAVPGEPDCKLTSPFVINIETDQTILEPFLNGVTKDESIMMSSDKILTLVDPTPTLLEKYQDLIKE